MATLAELWGSDTPAQGLSSDFASRLDQAKAAYREQFGKELPITSGFRTREDQQRLYDQRGTNPNPVAKPGTSLHESGNAADISPAVPESFLNQFGIHRPMGSKDPVHAVAMPTPASKQVDTLANLWESTPAATSKQEAKKEPGKETTGSAAADMYNQFQKSKRSLGEKIVGAGEAGLSALSGSIAYPVSAIGGAVGTLASGKYGTPEGVKAGEQIAQQMQAGGTYQPRTAQGQQYVQDLQKAFEASKLPPVGVPEVAGFAPLVSPAMQQAKGALQQWGNEIRPTAPQQMQQQFQAKLGTPIAENAQEKVGSVGAAKVEANPYANQITGEESARGQFPQVKLSKTAQDVPASEQATRAQIANEILGDTGQVRQGVVTGNENLLRNEHTKAKMANPTPEGELYKQQIANEQVALSNYAQKRIENTGASPTLVTPYERGQRINDAFAGDEGLAGFFKGEKKKLYNDVAEKVGENPIASTHVQDLLADKQFKAGLGLKGNEGVGRSAEELINHAKTIGFKDDMGNVHAPNTVGAWIAVQKKLNSDWTPQNASIIRNINQAIESDIGQAGGLDMLKKADSLHQAEKVLFGSKGIKQVFGDIDPNGVQTATAFDAIPQKLNSMPLDQWKHIYDTAEKVSKGTISGPIDKSTGMPKWTVEVPEELKISAQSAMNEMRGNLAREIYQAGAAKAGEWNQNSVNKILNARADKIKFAFSPEEQQAFHTLNMGGYLMPGVHGYEGAGQQMRRVGIVEGNLGKIGTTAGAGIGGAIAGPGGAAVGGYLGGKAGVAGSEAMASRAMQKQAQKSQEEMQKASQLGTKLSDVGKLPKPVKIDLRGMTNKD
jgi:hypothetical protein